MYVHHVFFIQPDTYGHLQFPATVNSTASYIGQEGCAEKGESGEVR